ncbi:hypothetical protein ACFPRL_32490 [Pseudoclavibacter helvolus]
MDANCIVYQTSTFLSSLELCPTAASNDKPVISFDAAVLQWALRKGGEPVRARPVPAGTRAEAAPEP